MSARNTAVIDERAAALRAAAAGCETRHDRSAEESTTPSGRSCALLVHWLMG
jgi:hypothetical protein